jgi:hypothetical protein
MDHIPVGEIASQLPMFIDPTMIVDNVLAGYWDAADALGNSPYVGDPDGLSLDSPIGLGCWARTSAEVGGRRGLGGQPLWGRVEAV